MKLNSIYAVNFRNYSSYSVDISAMINVFYGKNAQGKTNLLEAIFYSAFGLSHRTSKEDEMLKMNTQEMAVGVEYNNFTGNHNIKIKRQQIFGTTKKEILLDGNKVKPREHYGNLNVVMFSPEDLQLVKGEPALRRRYFDMQISQTDPIYYDLLVTFNRVLMQRNQLLKDIRDQKYSRDMLLVWDEKFADIASAIVKKRMEALKKLATISSGIYASISGNIENFTIKYEVKANNSTVIYPKEADICSKDYYLELLKERQQLDIIRGNTGIGPHRDDIIILLNDLSMKAYGSQGQQRSGALALKLSQIEYIYQEIGEYPLLLLDDVMSELDNNRRAKLLLFIDGKVQTFITVNDKELIPDLPLNAYFRIEAGNICEDKNE